MAKPKARASINWEFGPSFFAIIITAISILVTMGIMWGTQTSDTRAAAKEASDAKAAITEANKAAQRRDAIINDHSVTLGKIVTQLGYVSPALDRIEKKLDEKK